MDSNFDHQPKVVDLFCGAGGLSCGFHRAGFVPIAGFDKNSKFVDTWSKNHSGVAESIDLSEVKPSELKDKIPSDDVDLVIGGPPCKDFSKTNRKVDFGRNHLVTVFSEHVKSISPSGFLIENVRSLISRNEEIMEDVLQNLSDDYDISYRILDAADYGVPQHRLRAFVVGIKKEFLNYEDPMFPKPTHGPDSPSNRSIIAAGDALEDIKEPNNNDKYEIKSKDAHLLPDIPPGMNYSFYTEKLGHPDPKFEWRSKFSDYLYKADPEKPVRTIKAKPGAASGPFHWNNRKFTEDELKRLQGFPDSFVFNTSSYSATVEMIGNSVPPKLSYVLAMSILKQSDISVKLISQDKKLDFYSRRRTDTEEYKNKAEERIQDLYDRREKNHPFRDGMNPNKY